MQRHNSNTLPVYCPFIPPNPRHGAPYSLLCDAEARCRGWKHFLGFLLLPNHSFRCLQHPFLPVLLPVFARKVFHHRDHHGIIRTPCTRKCGRKEVHRECMRRSEFACAVDAVWQRVGKGHEFWWLEQRRQVAAGINGTVSFQWARRWLVVWFSREGVHMYAHLKNHWD